MYSTKIPELKADIYVPEYCYYLSADEEVDANVDINAWFGPANTTSPLHFDPKHNFLCQVTITNSFVRIKQMFQHRLLRWLAKSMCDFTISSTRTASIRMRETFCVTQAKWTWIK